MRIEEKLCNKFPAVLREKLLSGEIELPDTAMFEYEKIRTYRAVKREEKDFHEVTRDDFKSYYECGQMPKNPRGRGDVKKDPTYYGVSSFLKKEIVEQIMKFPNPHKKMAVGYIYSEGGPQKTDSDRGHVCWWLYEAADVSGFKLMGE